MSRAEHARAVWLGLGAVLVGVGVLTAFFLLYEEYLKPYFAMLPHLTSAAVQGAIAGGIVVGVSAGILGPRRTAIALYGQYFDWQCSLCGRIRPAKRR